MQTVELHFSQNNIFLITIISLNGLIYAYNYLSVVLSWDGIFFCYLPYLIIVWNHFDNSLVLAATSPITLVDI